jgi:hypothetical protein
VGVLLIAVYKFLVVLALSLTTHPSNGGIAIFDYFDFMREPAKFINSILLSRFLQPVPEHEIFNFYFKKQSCPTSIHSFNHE